MISTFRAARAQAQDKAPFDSLVEELAGQSKEFREWWKGVDVQGFDGGTPATSTIRLARIQLRRVDARRAAGSFAGDLYAASLLLRVKGIGLRKAFRVAW